MLDMCRHGSYIYTLLRRQPPTLHMLFTDRTGDGIVVEYVGGELQIHDNVAHVLTNAPTYDWHLLNARNYLNLSTVGVSSRDIGTVNVTAGTKSRVKRITVSGDVGALTTLVTTRLTKA